jgi:CheY-like chemotaxis protein
VSLFTDPTQATRNRLLATAALVQADVHRHAQRRPGPRGQTPPPGKPRTLRALVAEDSAPICDRLVELLTRPGEFEVSAVAATESEAIARSASQAVDLAIVDLQLARGTGFGVIRSLREANGPKTTIVVLTNHAIPALRIAAFEAGADYFLDKSKDVPDVARLVEKLLDARRRD